VELTERRPGAFARVTPVVIGAFVAALAALVLILCASGKPDDSAFVYLYETPSILAGDHPYRGFFEWGAPLSAYLSAAAQLITGGRLIGEMLLQWGFIVAGVVVAFRLSMRSSRSFVAGLLMLPLVLILLARTPTYHYSKLFCFPVAILLGWRYLEQPTLTRIAALGAWTSIAFLFRHDYAIWVGFVSTLALVLAWVAHPPSGMHRKLLRDGALYVAVAIAVISPWVVIVEQGEGVADYAQARLTEYESAGNPYAQLLHINPLRELRVTPLPPPTPGVVVLVWASDVDEAQKRALEQMYGLTYLGDRDQNGRLRYRVANLYAPDLLALRPSIRDENGFQWERLEAARGNLPTVANSNLWLAQMAMLVPLALIASGGLAIYRNWSRGEPMTIESMRSVLAGAALALIDQALLREMSYVVTVAPMTAALSARFLTGSRITRAVTVVLLVLSLFAAFVSVRGVPLFERSLRESGQAVSAALVSMTASPPDAGNPTFAYLRECTTGEDRLMVGGETPFYVNYYTGRPIAGGHVYWHTGWRADSMREAESLALLERQSVPFIVWTSDTVLGDLRRYPRIREYVVENYAELEGSAGTILFDRRKHPTRTYGAHEAPCFS
jgi:hypothetical protein